MSHTEVQMDPNEQTNMRYRLFGRAIRINGLSQLSALYPYLQARLRKTVNDMICPQTANNGPKCPLDLSDVY